MNEKLLQNKVMSYCRAHDILSFKFAAPSHAGVPDLILFCNGMTVLIELKHPNGRGRLSELQRRTILKIKQQGIPVYVEHDYDHITSIIRAEFNL